MANWDRCWPIQQTTSHPKARSKGGIMAKTKQDDKKKDSRGDEIDMSAHIPKGTSTAHEVEINQEAKLNDLGEGIHTTSATFGDVVSDEATDAVGLTPELNAERTGTDKRSRSSKGSD